MLMQFRRWISGWLVVAMLASFAGWPVSAFSSAIEHESEVLEFGLDRTDPSGDPQCDHGCVGHFGQHFQWQPVCAAATLQPRCVGEAIQPRIALPWPQQDSSPPFRPPRERPIQS